MAWFDLSCACVQSGRLSPTAISRVKEDKRGSGGGGGGGHNEEEKSQRRKGEETNETQKREKKKKETMEIKRTHQASSEAEAEELEIFVADFALGRDNAPQGGQSRPEAWPCQSMRPWTGWIWPAMTMWPASSAQCYGQAARMTDVRTTVSEDRERPGKTPM
jgi:hypothetical protein